MKKHFILFAGLILLATSPIGAQNTPASDDASTTDIISYSGGYGHFFTGPAWANPKDLIDHLGSPEVMGSSFKWNNSGFTVGAEGYAELHRLLVGFGGFGMTVSDMEADGGTVRFAHGGGLVRAGYAVFQKPKYFLSLIAGFGGGITYVGIDNTSDSPIYFSSTEPIAPGKDKEYYRAYLMYDLTLGNKLIATRVYPNSRRFGGFMVGLDLGATFGFPIDIWRDDNSSVTGIPSPGTIISPFIRLTVGGGGFRKQVINSR